MKKMEAASVYAAPNSQLLEKPSIPATFLGGTLNSSRMKFAGWMTIIYLSLFSVVSIISVAEGFLAENIFIEYTDWISGIVLLAIWIYLILTLKTLLNRRFEHNGSDLYIKLLIGCSILETSAALLMDLKGNGADTYMFTYFAFVFIAGVISVLFGKSLLAVKCRYSGLNLYAWSEIALGVCMVTVIFYIVIGIPITIVACIGMAKIFFNAASELSFISENAE